MKRLRYLLIPGMLVLCQLSYSQQDSAAYRTASSISTLSEKIRALEEFVRNFPASKLRGKAYDGLFSLYVERGNEAAALDAAAKYLESVPPVNRISPYNRYAYALAERNIGLDTALAYATRAEELARTAQPRSLPSIQDTRAYVLYLKGASQEAERLQREAIVGHEDDPEFVGHLALYEEKNGKRLEALNTMARALLLGSDPQSKQTFLTWLEIQEKDPVLRDSLKQSIIMTTVHASLDTLRDARMVAARSNAAAYMADLHVDLGTALTWAEAAVGSLSRNSQVTDVAAFKQNLALVLVAQERYTDALAALRSVEDLVDPYDARYWMTLGDTFEKVGDNSGAINAYMQGLIPARNGQLRAALETAYRKEHGSVDSLDQKLDLLRQESSSFEPGQYGRETTPEGKVVLAELFTGAECGPCVGADLAFDALSEYYPRTALAILEYHVHIPGPDPLTTTDSWDRYRWYAGEGTPTVVIDGRDAIVGGGSKATARNRFNVYRYAVGKVDADAPRAELSLQVESANDTIRVTTRIARTGGSSDTLQPILHIALIERAVDYTGSNGIAKHAFVVRNMPGGSAGTPVALTKEGLAVSKRISLAEVEREIKAGLDNPSGQAAWPKSQKTFAGWKSRPERLNRSNLAIVAWLQDGRTKEVLQAAYGSVPSGDGGK